MKRNLFSLVLFLFTLGAQASGVSCPLSYAVVGANLQELGIINELKGRFDKLPLKTSEETRLANENTLRELNGMPPPLPRVSARKKFANLAEREKLYEDLMAIPEVKESMCGSYKGSGVLGFCFGRAMAVHLGALRSGFDRRSIRKIWAVGDLNTGGKGWNFHVATIIRGENGKWYAIDPFLERPLMLEEWYAQIRQNYDPSKTVRIFSTDANRLLPYGDSVYDKKQLNRAVFHGFFRDLFESMRIDHAR